MDGAPRWGVPILAAPPRLPRCGRLAHPDPRGGWHGGDGLVGGGWERRGNEFSDWAWAAAASERTHFSLFFFLSVRALAFLSTRCSCDQSGRHVLDAALPPLSLLDALPPPTRLPTTPAVARRTYAGGPRRREARRPPRLQQFLVTMNTRDLIAM